MWIKTYLIKMHLNWSNWQVKDYGGDKGTCELKIGVTKVYVTSMCAYIFALFPVGINAFCIVFLFKELTLKTAVGILFPPK